MTEEKSVYVADRNASSFNTAQLVPVAAHVVSTDIPDDASIGHETASVRSILGDLLEHLRRHPDHAAAVEPLIDRLNPASPGTAPAR